MFEHRNNQMPNVRNPVLKDDANKNPQPENYSERSSAKTIYGGLHYVIVRVLIVASTTRLRRSVVEKEC